MAKKTVELEEASFSAGCFWGVEEEFRCTKGVVETEVGYMGGTTENPTYEEVCTGTTGHAETVHLKFDPKKISYDKLLDIFWSVHDPTQLNRQGPDFGSNYRSIIFYYSPEQEKLAMESKDRLAKSGKYKNDIVTEIVPAAKFWRAEEYHQKYEMKTGRKVC
jgi:peptide-methionine (S)-S-oxide reductase